MIFRDFATTGDGELTAIQLLSQMRRTQAKLSDLAKCMKRFPQTLINIKTSPEGKLAFYTDPAIKEAIEEAKQNLGAEGRLVVRASGTEPLMRVMVEHADAKEAERIAKEVATVIDLRLNGTKK